MKLKLADMNLSQQTVLLRVDFNVPLAKDGTITDDTRIVAALPTIRACLDKAAKIVIMSHLGRPDGKVTPSLSLAPVAKRLSELLALPVKMASDCVGPECEKLAKALRSKELLMLENLRFHAEEEKPTEAFVASLAALGTCYINDAFGCAHRKHASTANLAEKFPGQAGMGLLMEKELDYLGAKLLFPKRPFLAIVGGAKVSSKLGVLKALLEKVDFLFICGAMAATFLKAQGHDVGASLVEDAFLVEAKAILVSNKKVILPCDLVWAATFAADSPHYVGSIDKPRTSSDMALDIGPKTLEALKPIINQAQTIFWNGPAGVFEMPAFAKGTQELAQMLATSKATTIVGGGDCAAAVSKCEVASKISFISTGGGASLEFIEYGHLPGVDSLSDVHK